jgi:peptidoglycan/xylan/chitin deacetylase (PgdA/CDA1 family)
VKPPVLMYHGFGRRAPPDDPNYLFVPLEDFEAQVVFLARWLQPLDLRAYLAGLHAGRWPRRAVLLTIDDGYASTLTGAAPILARHAVPAVLFVPPRRVGGSSDWIQATPNETLLTAAELRELPRLGIDVQVHGMTHRSLLGLSRDELNTEVAESRDALADIMGEGPSRTLAYPEGMFDRTVVEAVRRAGYEAAFSVFEGGAGRYSITRRPVTPLDSLLAFRLKLAPGFESMWRATALMPRVRRMAALTARQRRKEGPATGPSGPRAHRS